MAAERCAKSSFSTTIKRCIASRRRTGYKPQTVQVTRDFSLKDLLIELPPQTREVYFRVEPAAGIVSVDGKPLSADPVEAISTELAFPVDERNYPKTCVVTAERKGFLPARQMVAFSDLNQDYVLTLQPPRKDLSITTEPEGAEIYVDGELIGTSPVVDTNRAFQPDIDTGELQPHSIRAAKAGYDPVELEVGWDDGSGDYQIDLGVKQKTVRIVTEPDGADITIDGVGEGQRRGNAIVYDQLTFPPTNDRGDLRVYKGIASKKATDSAEWYPAEFEIAWDGGKTDYHVALKEILAHPLPLLVASTQRTGPDGQGGWQIVPEVVSTMASKDVTDGKNLPKPTNIARVEKGQSIGSIAASPDGTRIVFTILSGKSHDDFRSIIRLVRTDGSGTPLNITDGRSLDLMPSFSPGGDQIIFSSNRAGRRMQICSMSADGSGGITRLTTADTNDLWPTLDSDPKPRLFYQAMVDTRTDPRLYMTQVGTIFQTDLTPLGGEQPRIGPKNDSLLFSAANEQTAKRDIFRVSDHGGSAPENLTNTPDADEFDPVWTRDGRKSRLPATAPSMLKAGTITISGCWI